MKTYFRNNLSDINNEFFSHHYNFVKEKVHETTKMMNNIDLTNYDKPVSILTVIDSFSLDTIEDVT